MSSDDSPTGPPVPKLEVRRTVRASPDRVFAAWTDPDRLKLWWGPGGVNCPAAEVDLRVGGRYRIANRFPDGTVVWIAGEFEVVAPPHELVYSWRLENESQRLERVTVTFEPRGAFTEVVIVHERIADALKRDRHEQGWRGCLDGLAGYLDRAP